MYFDATPTNMVAILVTVPGIVGVIQLMRKQYDSNLPLLFYLLALVFTFSSERAVDPFVVYGGLGAAGLLRFEFMGQGVTKVVAVLAAILLIWFAFVLLSVPFSFR